jgi:hypothetical protein
MLACRRRGLDGSYGRGFDDLPVDVLDIARGALVASLERTELMRALNSGVGLLLQESEELRDLATKLEPQLLALAAE